MEMQRVDSCKVVGKQ